jgi:spore maturation protein CgeB
MTILFVHASCEWAIADVAHGYREALARQGHTIIDYRLSNRLAYHAAALGAPLNENTHLVSRLGSEGVLIEALQHGVDQVLILSGLGLHPNALWLLKQAGIPTAVLLTESPYEDIEQATWAAVYPEMRVFCNDRVSARQFGWTALSHAYDPARHRPVPPTPGAACDVLIIGTGWPERVALLNAVDWTGIDLRIAGVWPIAAGDPLAPYYAHGCVDNEETPGRYAAAKICLNFHRGPGVVAENLNPRAFELAACGAFQLSDGSRPELAEIFGDLVPTFATAAELADQIRFYLSRPEDRRALAVAQRHAVDGQTFDARAAELMAHLATRRTSEPSALRDQEVARAA